MQSHPQPASLPFLTIPVPRKPLISAHPTLHLQSSTPRGSEDIIFIYFTENDEIHLTFLLPTNKFTNIYSFPAPFL